MQVERTPGYDQKDPTRRVLREVKSTQQPAPATHAPVPTQLRIPNTYDLLPQNYPRSPYHSAPEQPKFLGSLTKEDFVKVCTSYLDAKAHENNKYVTLPTHAQPESVFFSVSKPDISTEEYVVRLVSYTHCSPSAFVVMLVFLDRVASVNPRLQVSSYNLHRLLITALMLACKVVDDNCYSTLHYAKVGGIPTAREMNRLEVQFLQFVDFRLHVAREDFLSKQRDLHRRKMAIV